MKSTVEPAEGNKVKVHVEIDAAEFETDINAAFKRIAKEVRLPGFRQGKAPRKLLEARLGANVGRQEALREALPNYYTKAVIEHDVDVIAPPSIDITGGEESGAVTFDAIVEVRPSIDVHGYRSLKVEVPSPHPTDDEVQAQLDRLREQFSSLQTVERPIQDGDHVTLDINGSFEDEPVPGLTATDYLFEVGKGTVVPEIDENLRGKSAGETIEFDAAHPDPEQEGRLEFTVVIKQVQEKHLPPVDDDFAQQASEFDTADALRADIVDNLAKQRRSFARYALRLRTTTELAKLVEDDLLPEAMIASETNANIQGMVNRVQSQGIDFNQYLKALGREPQSVVDEARTGAVEAVKIDLALRAIADAENIEITEDDIDKALEPAAVENKIDVETARQRLGAVGQLSVLRSDLRKQKALDWLIEQVEIVDPDGTVIDRAALGADDEGDDADSESEEEDDQ